MGESKNKEHMFNLAHFEVPPGKQVLLKDYDPAFTGGLENKKEGKEVLFEDVTELAEAQTLLWASAQKSVLIIFQAMDAAGKDGTIKHVMSGVNPQGIDVHSFKAPNETDRSHHFLWRFMQRMPARGRITIFNRSYYEEVLVVRVHPELLDKQHIPTAQQNIPLDQLWQDRYKIINTFEDISHRQDICIIKFFLNLSKKEQKERFLERLNNPEKNWKFSAADLSERKLWDQYQTAYEDMLNATSTEQAPWYIIPADHKWFARAAVADIITARIQNMNLEPPKVDDEQLKKLKKAKKELLKEN
jgi:PPK2 family polyphosphate:nucleotide phosphotransferase